ncbi:alpha-1-antitrypsin-like [Carettochelys insculpta]|uniref:alpha-1-antitrypsin-like n=1 Tax=Carettochelys insculpta TaxID=44489 RepID=UPI003EBA9A85
MKSILSLCLTFAGLCAVVQVHHVPEHHNNHDGQRDKKPPAQPSPVRGNVRSEHVAVEQVAASNADFAFKLYQQIRSETAGKNIFFSPLSISTAFAMLTLGARSATLRQIHEALSFNLTVSEEKEIHEGFHHLIRMLNLPDSHIQLNMGNALFVDDRLKPLEKFLDDAKRLYESEAFESNFQNSAEAEKQINDYIKNKTLGKITNLVKDLDPLTAMVLVNYIFFKARWEKPFSNLLTEEDDFFVDAKTSVKVKMMNKEKEYKIHHDKKLSCRVVEIPYRGNAVALFILPDKGKMKKVENALLKETVSKWKKSLQQSTINLYLPAFSISGTYDVKELLQKMGVTDVFSDQADLSGITGECDLKVSKAVHKAVVDVHENGTEAAAVTVVETMYFSAALFDPPTIKFNRPFLMLIADKAIRSILFIGKIVNPTEK